MVALSAKSVEIDVLANDEPNATLMSVSQPRHGRATMVRGRVIYVSEDNFDGEDRFDYSITLASGETLQGRVVLQVKGNTVTRDLALTGANSLTLTATALALLALGLVIVFGTRRRREDQ
jgi:LPXTG-motif cell wall-anchored protein